MALQFDSRGYLKPYNCCKLSLLEFEAFFVNSFESNESRRRIFDSYKAYLDAFSIEICTEFTQWLDGSFLTTKQMPRDLDFVTLLNFQIANDKRDLLRSKFLKTPAFGFFGLDAYLVEVFPAGHPNFVFGKSDLAYWNRWFSRSRENRAKKSFPKGFVEIEFSNQTIPL